MKRKNNIIEGVFALKKNIAMLLILWFLFVPVSYAAEWIEITEVNGENIAYNADAVKRYYRNGVEFTSGEWRMMDLRSKTGYISSVIIRNSDGSFINTHYWKYVNGQFVSEGESSSGVQQIVPGSYYNILFSAMVSYGRTYR